MNDIVMEKPSIFAIREVNQGWMDKLTDGVEGCITRKGFFPSVFYNENDINHPELGIRAAIPDLDNYPGIFIHQDAPDTPIDGYKGVEFRSSITKSWAKRAGNQLLWTVQDLTHLPVLPGSEYDDTPEIQFCGTVVLHETGQVFPQQRARYQALISLGTCGLKTQINLKLQQCKNGVFTQVSGQHLTDEQYWNMIRDYPYGLSVRGWGNWDLRMYELLASGRIPVHINTDDELLFEKEIPWDDLIVRIDNLQTIREKVTEFHSQFTDSRSLAAHQKKLAHLYREYLSYPAFCRRFEEYYEEDLQRLGVS